MGFPSACAPKRPPPPTAIASPADDALHLAVLLLLLPAQALLAVLQPRLVLQQQLLHLLLLHQQAALVLLQPPAGHAQPLLQLRDFLLVLAWGRGARDTEGKAAVNTGLKIYVLDAVWAAILQAANMLSDD